MTENRKDDSTAGATGGRYAGKHTKKSCYAVEGENGVYCDWAGKQVRLATVHTPDWHEDHLCGSREAFANAQLYAAAPDMYEALQQARSWLSMWASAEKQLAVVDAALAKAEGRPPG